MEKKKTIVLTMIGLATLMLLVIGSAFAYFSITNNSGGKTETNFTGETDQLAKYGTPTITGESNLYLDLLVTDMAQGKIGTSYWATDTKENRFEQNRKDHIVSTAGISGSNTEEEAYLNCTSDLTITASVKKSGEEEALEEDIITEGDGRVYLGYQSDKASNKATINPNEIDLATIISETKNNKGYKTTVNYTIVGDSSVNITAAIELKNTKDDQTALAGKDIDINISNENLVCSVGEKPKPTYAKVANTVESSMNGSMYGYGDLYRTSEYKDKIINVSFVDYVPSEEELKSKPKYWDLSDIESGTPAKSVIGWLDTNKETSSNYDLYIGSTSEIFVKDLSNAFYSMYNLKTINFDNLNTNETTNMRRMFSGSNYNNKMKISEINGIENFDTSKVTNMSYMFQYVSIELPFKEWSKFTTSNVENMSGMFAYYKGNTLDLSTFDTSKVRDMSDMFSNCTNLKDLPFKEWPNFVTTNVENMSFMFESYQGTTLDLSTFDTSQVTDMSYMFSNCTNLKDLPFKEWPNFVTTNVENMSSMFESYQGTTLDLSTFDTSKVTNMSNMFNQYKGTTLGLSTFDTSKVTDMSYMFSNCTNLKDLPFKEWLKFTTSNVENMNSMFESYQGTTLDLSTFDTSKVTDMNNMFRSTSIDLPFKEWPKFKTSNVESMNSMFSSYTGTTLDLSTFDTSKVTDMSYMFDGCTNLSNLDLSNATFDKINNQSYTFRNVQSSCVVKIKSSQQEIFESKFPLNGSSKRTFTPTYVD